MPNTETGPALLTRRQNRQKELLQKQAFFLGFCLLKKKKKKILSVDTSLWFVVMGKGSHTS